MCRVGVVKRPLGSCWVTVRHRLHIVIKPMCACLLRPRKNLEKLKRFLNYDALPSKSKKQETDTLEPIIKVNLE